MDFGGGFEDQASSRHFGGAGPGSGRYDEDFGGVHTAGGGGGFGQHQQQQSRLPLETFGGGAGGSSYGGAADDEDGGGGGGFLVGGGGLGGITGPMFGTGDFEGGGGFLMHGGGGGLGGFSQLGGGASMSSRHQMNTFMPVKIGGVMNAFRENPNESMIALAPPPAPPLHLIRIVGRISRLVYNHTSSVLGEGESTSHSMLTGAGAGPVIDYSSGRACFELEDGTGVVNCEWLLGDDITPYKQRLVESLLVLNNYVRVYGQMSTLGQAIPMLRVHAVRPVISVADVLFHEIDCCSSYLRLKHFGQALPDPLEVASSSRGGGGGHGSQFPSKSTSSTASTGTFPGGQSSSSSSYPSSSSTSASSSSYQGHALSRSSGGVGGEGGGEEEQGGGDNWGGGYRHMTEGSRKGEDYRRDGVPGAAGGHRPGGGGGGGHNMSGMYYQGDGDDSGGSRWIG
ncbi:replication protein [Cystoisospora suis]|uniref:Replication protein n=1 Tax=Cystoisospora suis TaxID=483139 RepID=A0A2C6L111_9APIC|nr:replication protein [Cystoisospora suis]